VTFDAPSLATHANVCIDLPQPRRERLRLALRDGLRLGVPLARFPRLMRASAEAREAVEISASGLHREALDEDTSVAGLPRRAGRYAAVR
jgi:hypothetical protein